MAEWATASVKIIDPEFAVYAPPGLDIGCLLSGFVLAAVFHHTEQRSPAVSRLVAAIGELWTSYAATMAARHVAPAVLSATATDAVGFAGCEVARTALGFAGVRGLPIKEADLKEKAEALAVTIAHGCIVRRHAGLATLTSLLETLS
uniref:Uncharacterized protein n=1 Tax=Haptolina ericina TaxID=156174 RepID=A0A7S3AXT4_9EUKA|mmetsp:Transcript_4039/g.8807  ORF Transcript_4039/g.8807 Transcript_4039/m.8807 type:complete len:147 (+) Transcript_4039:107-547(+)